MNQDPVELERFNKLARHFWDPKGPMRPLHDLNPLRIQWIEQQYGHALDGVDVLDVGCGGGIASEGLAKRGARVTGLDAATKLLQAARLHAEQSELAINYVEALAEDYAAQHPESFDLVVCLEMLEHVPDPAAVVNSVAKLLRPGGVAVFSTLNRTPLGFGLGIVAAEYLLKWVEPGTHTWKKFIKPSELAQAARTAGLAPTHMTGLTYNPLIQQFVLAEKHLDVNYLMSARKPQ